MYESLMIPVPGLRQEPTSSASAARLLDACDIDADSVGGVSVPSSVSSAVLSDFFIFDNDPLLADWGTLPTFNASDLPSGPLFKCQSVDPYTGWMSDHVPASAPPPPTNPPIMLNGSALIAPHPKTDPADAWLQLGPTLEPVPSALPLENVPMTHTQSLPDMNLQPLHSWRSPSQSEMTHGCGPVERPSSKSGVTQPMPRSVSASQLQDASRPLVPHMTYLTPLHLRKGKGGRQPAADPRMDPRIDPKKARRILANRLSAAKSKLKQKGGGAGDVAARARGSYERLAQLPELAVADGIMT